MNRVCGEFFKGGALSVDKLIEERAPLMLKNPYFSISNDSKSCVMCKRPRVTAVTPSPRAHPRQKTNPQLTPRKGSIPRAGPKSKRPPKPLQGQYALENCEIYSLD